MTRRRNFTRDQKAAIARRATVNGTIFCEGCGVAVTRFEVDHKLAEALVVDKSRKLAIEDGQLLGIECCHRGPDGKTAKDVKAIAKAKRAEAKHLGIARDSKPIESRGFQPTRKSAARKAKAKDKIAVPPPRQLYKQKGKSDEIRANQAPLRR